MIRNEPRKPIIGQRNGLNIRQILRAKTKLKVQKPINKITQKQRERNKNWSEVTNKRIEQTGSRCEWCGKLGQRNGTLNFLSGHHKVKRRFGNDSIENCYVAHMISCHQFIEDNSVDVSIYKNRLDWEKRNA
jgi:hypothetical protein